MSCISDELIQKYIDNETSEKENTIIRAHAENCSRCAKAIEERRVLTSQLKALINSGNNQGEIPEFIEKDNVPDKKSFHINRWIIYGAAACILAAIFIFYPKQEENIELMFSYNIESEYNANAPLSEQEMVLEIIDSKGNLITF